MIHRVAGCDISEGEDCFSKSGGWLMRFVSDSN